MKWLFLPVFLFSFYYPLDFKFQFIHNCMQNSSLNQKYEYCECVYNKLTSRFSYYYFRYNASSPEVLNFLVKSSKECIKEVSK
ncbi:MAG: hypothetical protein GXO62_05660 [Epsilonproteobacteria bacterium]|nr:hypothetical protein [Campylobacterota bacterium]